jgi:hypothetical protein
MTIWIETIGFLASGLTVLTYLMRDMLWLRVVAVTNCTAFLVYAALIGSTPIVLMELVLLPINAWRLLELFGRAGAADRAGDPRVRSRPQG